MAAKYVASARHPISILLVAFLLGMSFLGGVAGAASPTATHVQPAPVKVGEAIPLNVTIDTHNTIVYSVTVIWWTSLSNTRYIDGFTPPSNATSQIQLWSGNIPAQGKACQVYYFVNITYYDYDPSLPWNPSVSIYLPGTQGNYLVTVKGDIFAASSLISIAIGICLMVLAVGVIIYAQRATPKWDPRYEETVKKSKEKVELDEKGSIKGEAGNVVPEGQNGASSESSGPEGKPNAGKTAKKVKMESNGSPPTS